MLLVPRQFGLGAVPDNAPPELIELLRIFGGPMIGIAVLNWLARSLEPSPALKAIVVGNVVGFGCVAASDVWGVFTGGSRPVAKVFLVIHVLLALAFGAAWQRLRHSHLGSAR